MKITQLILEHIQSYDSITRMLVRDIINEWKEVNDGEDESLFEMTYDSEDFFGRDLSINLFARLTIFEGEGISVLDSTGADALEEIPSIHIEIEAGNQSFPNIWSDLYFLLIDIIRHEIEHLTQMGANKKEGKPGEDEQSYLIRSLVSQGLLSQDSYLLIPSEIDANLQGLRLSAKKQKRSLTSVVKDYFDVLKLPKEAREKVLKLWRIRAKELGFNRSV